MYSQYRLAKYTSLQTIILSIPLNFSARLLKALAILTHGSHCPILLCILSVSFLTTYTVICRGLDFTADGIWWKHWVRCVNLSCFELSSYATRHRSTDSMSITVLLYLYGTGTNIPIFGYNMIKGNESLVENFNFYFLTPLSQNLKMLHFDANPLQLDIWL